MKKKISDFFKRLFQVIKNFFCKTSSDIEKDIKTDGTTFVDDIEKLLESDGD